MNITQVQNYESSDDDIEVDPELATTSKKKTRTSKVWLIDQTFSNAAEAKKYIKDQKEWSFHYKNSTAEGNYFNNRLFNRNIVYSFILNFIAYLKVKSITIVVIKLNWPVHSVQQVGTSITSTIHTESFVSRPMQNTHTKTKIQTRLPQKSVKRSRNCTK